MTCTTKIRILAVSLFALISAHASFAAPISGCTNNAGSPKNISGTLFTTYTCNFYNTGGSYTIDMTPVLTSGGALLADNAVGAGYLVVINGNPLTLADNSTGLFNQSLWDAVLYFPGDFAGGTESDKVTVDWSGSFPTGATVKSTDNGLYSGAPDSAFFVQATGSETTIGFADQQYNVFTDPVATPEPSSLVLLFSGILGLAMFLGAKHVRRSPLGQGVFTRS